MSAVAFESEYQTLRRRHRTFQAGAALMLLALVLLTGWVSEASPKALAEGLPRVGEYLVKLIPDIRLSVLFDGPKTEGSLAFWMYRADSWLWLLFETSQIAALATFTGACIAFLLCFPAAANLAPNRAVYALTRRGLELFRTVPDIVYALMLVWAFGVGPLAGIAAITLHTVGALGKLFAEAVENASMGPWQAMQATGANWPQSVRYAIVPQVLPNLLSYTLLRFEMNVRGATVIGFVGAGGIGQELYQVISFSYYQEISAIVALIIMGVMVIDLTSEALRHRVIGQVA
jgi:phosphonate transport system permease protein